MKKYDMIDLDSAAKLLSALILLEQFLAEIRATIHILEAFQDLDIEEHANN